MATANGVGTSNVGAPIDLGHFLPEQRTVKVNGESYQGWVVTNRRYPRKIMVRLDALAREYGRVIGPLLEETVELPTTATGQELIDALNRKNAQNARRVIADNEQEEAYSDYMTGAIMLLVPTLLESEVEMIPRESAEELLRELGYFRPKAAPVEDEDAAEPEVSKDPAPLTGATSRGASRTSTPATQTNAS